MIDEITLRRKQLSFYSLPVVFGLFGLILYNNAYLMYATILIQSCILLYYLFSNNEKYLCSLLLFVSLSQEFSYFLDADVSNVVLYSFKETRVLGINLSLIFTVLFFVKIVIFDNAISILSRKSKSLEFFKWLAFLCIISIITGSINLVRNDNGILGLKNVWMTFFQEISFSLQMVILSFCILFVLIRYGKVLVEKTIIMIMLANLILPIIASLLGIQGTYGGKVLYLTLSSFLICPLVLIVPAYPNYSSFSIVIIISFIAGVLFPLFFRSIAFGKLIFIIIFSLLLFVALKSKRGYIWLIGSAIAVVLVLVFWNSIINILSKNNSLFSYKYKQVLSVIKIWESGWYENMLPSPKVRFTELVNIIIELSKNPINLLLGKGFLGTTKDHLGQIQLFNLGIYSYDEFIIQSYYGMHESVNTFLLSNGILGLFFVIKYLVIVIKHYKSNPWIIIGGLWLLLLWGYSTTRAFLGLSCLCLGLYMIHENVEPRNIKEYEYKKAII